MTRQTVPVDGLPGRGERPEGVGGGKSAAVRRGSIWVAWVMLAMFIASEAVLVVLLVTNGTFHQASLQEPLAALPLLLPFTAFMVVGALIVAHRPGNAIGWIFSAIALLAVTGALAQEYADYGYMTRSGALPGAILAAWLASWMWYPTIALAVVFTPLLFPTGRLSPRWRPTAWLAAATTASISLLAAFQPSLALAHDRAIPNPIAVAGLENPEQSTVGAILSGLGLTLMIAAAVSLLIRFRRSRDDERQQLKWFAYAGALVPLVALSDLLPTVVGNVVAAALFALLPVAAGIAILRYRLYDIDRLISRTVVYGLLTVGGIAVYVGVVKGAEWLVREGVGLGGSLVATAVIAVGFAPARDHLQRLVDRRLYGERRDPVRAVARLGERLRDAPGGAPGGDILTGVLQEVCETLRLPSASLWGEDGTELASFGRPASGSESIPLEHEGQRIGDLMVGMRAGEHALGAADREVLGILAAPVAVALHAVLLSRELQRSRERLVAAREEERRRLRRDLHDGLGPILTAVTLKADAARSALDTAPDRTAALLAELRGDAQQAIGDLRRVIYDLRPAPLDELGLLGALSQQVDRFARQGLLISLHAPPNLPVLPAAVEVASYRICTEALTNVARHAHAHHVSIVVAVDGALCLEVLDDGTASTANGDRWRPGVGLTSMAERVAEVGGILRAGPTPTGGRVYANLPLALA
jgi:signal transduction histidine kinase